MKVASTIAEARATCKALRSSPHISLGLVPTMGALHEGHLSLVRAARQSCDIVAVSLFVNPTQFGPSEDLARYPRPFETDRRLLAAADVDLLFAPTPAEMYPSGSLATFVDPGDLGNRLDGASRPGHFRGVCTVVAKLFHILTPNRAFFGQKDAAQVAVLLGMVRDLNFPLELITCPTVRDADGLALSSRNTYLSPEQRVEALALSRALRAVEVAVRAGETDATTLLALVAQQLGSPAIRVDYVALVDPVTLLPLTSVQQRALLAIAAWIGNTRLIDNVLLSPEAPEGQA